jgi:hypothetical protein
VRTASLMAAAVAASGGVFLASGAADPLMAAAAAQVAARTAPDTERSGEDAASPGRAVRVSWSWGTGAPSWNATLPQPSRLTPVRSIDPATPAKPARPAQPRQPDGTPPDTARPWNWYGIAATNPRVELASPRSCPQFRGPSARIWMTVTPGKGQVTLSWWDIADPEAVRWEIGAFARTANSGTPSMSWTRVPNRPGGGCGTVTARITGLESGVGYDFWLETVNRDPLDPSRTYRMSRGRTEVFDIP